MTPLNYEPESSLDRRVKRLERNLWAWRILAVVFGVSAVVTAWVIGAVMIPRHSGKWPFW